MPLEQSYPAASRSTHSLGGTFGAGAAAGALFGLEVRQVRHLLSLCAQQASGIGCHVRDPEHVEKAFDFGGMPARNGVTAAGMVAAGMSGVDDVFSGERNFFEAFAPEPNPQNLYGGLGEHFEILHTSIKKWPVGSPAQAALDSVTALIESDGIRPDDVRSIEVHLPGRSARTVDNAPMPNLNVQHLVAVLLIDGTLSFHSIHDNGRMADPGVLNLRRKIAVVENEELAHALPRRQAIVTIRMQDGRVLSKRRVAVRGTADNPMTTPEIEQKALDLIAGVLGPRRGRALLSALGRLETVQDILCSAPSVAAARDSGSGHMTLLLSNEDVEAAISSTTVYCEYWSTTHAARSSNSAASFLVHQSRRLPLASNCRPSSSKP